ncbi:hypothetical protein B0H14DRAFT_2900605 [Mycena olivaceomarginata]|nr:hypothetical protein B0H14DRAFT_2900605 [Mycena olivaceomarginata]
MSSPNTTPPLQSPCRVTDDLLDLTHQITPSKQSRTCTRCIRLNLQSRANDLRDDISAMKRRLTDFENQAVSSQRPHKQRKRHNRAADAESIENPNTLEDRTREKGHLFTIQEALFLDEDFDEGAEFSTDKNKVQGQLRQVLRYLPNDAKPFRSTSLIRGPSGAVGLFDGQSKRSAAKTIERMHRIRCALPGAITDSAILVRIFSPPPTFLIHLFQAIWLHSADTTLTEIGDQISINYRARHSYSLQHIVKALASNKAWAVDLLAYWDRTLFPDTDSPNGADGSAGREIEEDDEDFFASAQALTHPRSPRIQSSTSPPPRHLTPSPPSLQCTPAASSSRQEQENYELTSHGGHSHSPQHLQCHGEGQRHR